MRARQLPLITTAPRMRTECPASVKRRLVRSLQGPVIGQVAGFVWRLDRLGRSLPDRSRYPQISRLSGSDAPDKRLQRGHSLLTQLDRVVGLAWRGGGFFENAVGMEQERLLVREAIGPEVRQSDGELI